MDDRQRAAWRALGLGPIWTQRATSVVAEAPAADITPSDALAANALAVERSSSTLDPPASQLVVPEGAAADAAAPADLFADSEMETPPLVSYEPGERLVRLDALRGEVAGCPKCRLCQSRTQTVFGVGDPDARLMLIGEAPGAEEDARGDPFVGQAGRLLDAMLASIGVDRLHGVYIANVIKCRPPGNRNPQPDEVASCAPYLREQIALVQPAVLVLLGRFAAQTLLRTTVPVGAHRGRVHRYQDGARSVPAVVTFHPAYLLRNPVDKAKAWRDLCLARAELAKLEHAASTA